MTLSVVRDIVVKSSVRALGREATGFALPTMRFVSAAKISWNVRLESHLQLRDSIHSLNGSTHITCVPQARLELGIRLSAHSKAVLHHASGYVELQIVLAIIHLRQDVLAHRIGKFRVIHVFQEFDRLLRGFG